MRARELLELAVLSAATHVTGPRFRLGLIDTKSFPSGVLLLSYRPAPATTE